MFTVVTILLCAVADAPEAAPAAIGYLAVDSTTTASANAYIPQAGDLIFTSHTAPLRTMAYWTFRTGHPLHCGIVVRSSEGKLLLFETGGGDSKTTTLSPIDERFAEDLEKRRNARISIRPIRTPLSDEESARLTTFAEAELGKRLQPNYKYLRLFIPGRPAKASNNDHAEWFCSELVVQGLREAGAFETRLPAGSIVPADLYYDRRVNLADRWAKPSAWSPHPAKADEQETQAVAPTTVTPRNE